MTENVENLVLEQLRAIRAEMARLADHTGTLSAETRAIRHQLAAVVTLQDHDHNDVASIKVRLDRIERRLELVDPS